MVRAMRRVLEEDITSEEGTRAYHGDLAIAGIRPVRALADDLELTEPMLRQPA